MANETRILGSLVGAAFDSTADQPISIDSSKYLITGYVVTDFPLMASGKSQAFQVWTGPGRTGTEIPRTVGFATGHAVPDQACIITGPATNRVSTEATLYLSLNSPVQAAGVTGNFHVIGFDVP